MKTWNLIDAQDHLEVVFQSALDGEPQRIEQDFGRGAVVVLSAEDYARLAQHDFIAFMQASPLAEAIRAGRDRRLRNRPAARLTSRHRPGLRYGTSHA
ncbi:MAG TPA: hypothetical protein VFS20_24005 [Longimicrobium sp.]|nr:hypothetical protein [Longimicrobium sp.]